MKWNIGDIAICKKIYYIGHKGGNIKDIYPPLTYNGEYEVRNIYECMKCKRISLDVGFNIPINPKGKGVLCVCGISAINNGIYWCASERFVKREINQEEEENEKQELITIKK